MTNDDTIAVTTSATASPELEESWTVISTEEAAELEPQANQLPLDLEALLQEAILFCDDGSDDSSDENKIAAAEEVPSSTLAVAAAPQKEKTSLPKLELSKKPAAPTKPSVKHAKRHYLQRTNQTLHDALCARGIFAQNKNLKKQSATYAMTHSRLDYLQYLKTITSPSLLPS